MNNNNPAVLIAGAGPTGLVMALWLTHLGIKVRIIDKNERPGQTSRAVIVQARTLEFYHQIGIADEVIASGIKLDSITLFKRRKAIKNINVGEIGVDLSPYSFILSFPQDDHEQLLISQLKKMGVEIERNTELLSFQQTPEKITAIIHSRGQQDIAEFDYLCGCDGARSTTREQLEIKFPGGTYSQKFFVADVGSSFDIGHGLQIGVSEHDFCLAFPVRSSGTVRLIGIVPEKHEQQEEIYFEDVESSVTQNTPIKVNAVNWFSTYHVHHRVVPQFRLGRAFLVGDAAHIHSPVGGQGMNTGIGDAINLAWKLAAVLQGKCAEHILDTYQSERLPFAKKLVSTTDKMFQIVTSRSILGIAWRKFIFPRLMPMIFKYEFSRQFFFQFISQIKINYRQSALSDEGEGKIQAGDRLPWLRDAAKDNFASLQTIAWQVHVYGQADPLLRQTLQILDLPLIEFAWSTAAKKKGFLENAAYLIRPDGYISVIDLTPKGVHIKKMLDSLK